MKISLLNERLTIQKNSVTVDSVGNHKNEWTDYFSCYTYATASGYKQGESEKAGVLTAEEGLVFTVRHNSKTAALTTTGYRVVFRGENYNIISIDMMNYDHKSIKILCEKERRGS